MNQAINWNYIARAIDFYVGAGFQYIEVPWIVSAASIKTTLPANKKGYTTELGGLVASAEQSFIELMRGELLDSRPYVAATPCFRDDDPDESHSPYFFKVELFSLRSEGFDNSQVFLDVARRFFATLGADTQTVWVNGNYDIELNGVEIGSYGIRSIYGFNWTYGTGLAEPRFSYALSQKHE